MSTMASIAVVDYGMGNLRSVAKAVEHVCPHARVVIATSPRDIESADRVIFPGQGAMPDCMAQLGLRDLRDAVLNAARTKPFLGICIGLQMLFDRSEEGNTPGLGLLPGTVKRFNTDLIAQGFKIPHMGWNELAQVRPHPLWAGIRDFSRFYFVHSYYACPTDCSCIVGASDHGGRFTAAIAQDNIFAVQCHPEKSAHDGLRLLANFLAWKL
jgi:glutamine amidotransferase